MKLWFITLCLIIILILGGFHLFALMRLYPLYITSPLFFLAIYLTLSITSHRKTFRGFK